MHRKLDWINGFQKRIEKGGAGTLHHGQRKRMLLKKKKECVQKRRMRIGIGRSVGKERGEQQEVVKNLRGKKKRKNLLWRKKVLSDVYNQPVKSGRGGEKGRKRGGGAFGTTRKKACSFPPTLRKTTS